MARAPTAGLIESTKGHSFVLLDDARVGHNVPARLLFDPVEVRSAATARDISPLLDWLEACTVAAQPVAGYLSYEAGLSLEPPLGYHGTPDQPLAWFAHFSGIERIAADAVAALLPDPEGAWAGRPEPRITRADYDRAIARILDYIAAGDIYQANLTFQATVRFGGHPLALYARLRARQQAGYGGIIFTGTHWLLSFSPELFFSQKERSVMARPMKGTALRDADPVRDAAQAAGLADDPKQRAENLMIVDLIRNDLSRVAEAGSVSVPELFHVERYPTVHQMVSSVHATLAADKGAVDLMRQAFPCGSITGAPKIRAMEIIGEVESEPRGVYTGSIGYIAGPGEAAFNVAIRTLVIAEGSRVATLGLGSGIVADSVAASEWQECLAKGLFVESASPFDLIETMRFDPDSGIVRLARHLARLGNSAGELGFAFDPHATRNALQAATFRLREAAKLRLMVSRKGHIAIEIAPLPDAPTEPVAVAVTALPVDASDWRLRHKSSARSFYDTARKQATPAFEVVFTDPQGYLTEGSFTTIFVERDGTLLTPPLDAGLLPGTLRADYLDEGRASEATLTPDDLADGFFIGNSLRGLIAANMV